MYQSQPIGIIGKVAEEFCSSLLSVSIRGAGCPKGGLHLFLLYNLVGTSNLDVPTGLYDNLGFHATSSLPNS